jgi:dCMP deaminase
LIKEALLKEYDFDYAIRYEGKTPQQLLQQTIDDACKQNNTSQKDTCDMKCDGSNCYKCLFGKPSYLNICENQFFTLASEKELIRRLDANEYENRRDDIIKTLKEQYGYDYETKSIIDLDSGIRFKNHDDIISFETNDNGDDKMLYDDYMDSKMLNWTNDGDDTQMKLDDMINMYNSKRISKVEYYLGIADAVSKRGTCLRRNYGSVIVKDDHIVSTGYNGAPRGRVNCCDLGKCYRQEHNIPQGERYECCRSVHSEMNAVINASSEEMKGATLYLVGHENDGSLTDANCCMMCKRVIINSGISHVVLRQSNGSFKTVDVSEWIEHDDSLNM